MKIKIFNDIVEINQQNENLIENKNISNDIVEINQQNENDNEIKNENKTNSNDPVQITKNKRRKYK